MLQAIAGDLLICTTDRQAEVVTSRIVHSALNVHGKYAVIPNALELKMRRFDLTLFERCAT